MLTVILTIITTQPSIYLSLTLLLRKTHFCHVYDGGTTNMQANIFSVVTRNGLTNKYCWWLDWTCQIDKFFINISYWSSLDPIPKFIGLDHLARGSIKTFLSPLLLNISIILSHVNDVSFEVYLCLSNYS